jgi:hypothetical protein
MRIYYHDKIVEMKRIVIGCFVLAFFVGIGVSYWFDYRVWRHEETKNYGQGVGGVRRPDPEKLDTVYQNDVAGVRIRHPNKWKAIEDTRLKVSDPKKKLVDIVSRGAN